jgi:putative endonuclease
VARQWHCRWGELDLIVRLPEREGLAFVEVKARSHGNWDEGGRLSVNPQKQARLWQAAELFLAEHPEWSACPCRFDVALVVVSGRAASGPPSSPAPELGKWVAIAGRWLRLQDYIFNAFEG